MSKGFFTEFKGELKKQLITSIVDIIKQYIIHKQLFILASGFSAFVVYVLACYTNYTKSVLEVFSIYGDPTMLGYFLVFSGTLISLVFLGCLILVFILLCLINSKIYRDLRAKRYTDIATQNAVVRSQPKQIINARPKTSEYDIPKKLAIIDEVLDLFRDDFEELLICKNQTLNNWKNELQSNSCDALINKLRLFRSECSEFAQKIGRVSSYNERYNDIFKLLNQPYQSFLYEGFNKFIKAIEALNTLSEQPRGSFDALVDLPLKDLEYGIAEFEKWKIKTEKELIALRQTLSI